jgi:peptide-N4-(N-acetyl-beta-glucosaminyl)asparagine amidase
MDWTDHVWVEVKIGDTWAHIDPCEAAFNDKLMYMGWGKKHTYVIAFSQDGIEDVTPEYCSDMDAAKKRREITEEEFLKEIANAQSKWEQGLIGP